MKKFGLASGLAVITVVILLLLCFCGSSEQCVEFLTDQGVSAFDAEHYKDAAGWFKRAQIFNDGNKNPKLQACLWEMIGYSQWKTKDYDEAEKSFIKARFGFEHCCGSMSPEAARILNLWAGVYIEEHRYIEALQLLQTALEYSVGKDSNRYDDMEMVPYRVVRLGEVADFRRQPADGFYASTIDYLSTKSQLGNPEVVAKVRAAIKQLFADWKTRLEKSPSSSGSAAYNDLWSQVYGGSSTSAGVIPQPN